MDKPMATVINFAAHPLSQERHGKETVEVKANGETFPVTRAELAIERTQQMPDDYFVPEGEGEEETPLFTCHDCRRAVDYRSRWRKWRKLPPRLRDLMCSRRPTAGSCHLHNPEGDCTDFDI
jgi:hypothetical protein